MTAAAASLRARLPKRTVRFRLTAVYGGVFLLSGTALLTIIYFLARRQYTGNFFLSTGHGAVAKLVVTQAGFAGGNVGGPAATAGPFAHTVVKPPTKQAVAAAANAQSSAALHGLLVISGIALAIMALVSIWLGWVMAGRALRPLRTITSAAREISASNLHRRLALEGPDDELRQLGTTFDGLLARLEASFEAQRQFVANASHELRTPLTFERTLLEVALDDPEPTVASLRRTCTRVLGVSYQQEHLIEALLTLSRSQRGLDRHDPVDLAAITAAATAALDRDGLEFATELEPARTTGDPRLVERLVANLLSNAVRHNVPDGRVAITTGTVRGRAVVAVSNTGRTILPSDVEQLFRPFQRLDPDRTNQGPGLGLGLSIVDAIARAHRAVVTTEPQPEGGLRIRVAFPAVA